VRRTFRPRQPHIAHDSSARFGGFRAEAVADHSLRLSRVFDREIKMVVVSAPWIELLAAVRAARFALHVLTYAQLGAASAAKNCSLLPLALRPDFDRMSGERLMTFLARIIHAATLHFDRDDVGWAAIMLAARLRIQIYAAHIQSFRNHNAPGEIAYRIEPRRARHLNVK
jgi:hypothetical protein